MKRSFFAIGRGGRPAVSARRDKLARFQSFVAPPPNPRRRRGRRRPNAARTPMFWLIVPSWMAVFSRSGAAPGWRGGRRRFAWATETLAAG